MSKTNGIEIYLGAGAIGDKSDPNSRYTTPDAAKEYLDAFAARGYNRIDTARVYPLAAPGTSEQFLGEIGAAQDFVIDSKYPGLAPGTLKAENMEKHLGETLGALKAESVNVMYLHGPDSTTPLEETCQAVHRAYEAGKFKYFGLSNYPPEQVEQIIDICTKNNWVKPTVYQGQYNVVLRQAEQLLPLLRKYGMQFVAYSPAVGGFLSGLEFARPGSRFDPNTPVGQFYASWYGREELKQLAAKAVDKIKAEGIAGHAAALRWTIYHSQLQKGDAVIIAASNVEQLKENIDAAEAGPLPQPLVELLDDLFKKAAVSI
ncbi:hypothetical protein VTO42DRAFT_2339 [Malbranchea cinnamomea]